MQKDFDTWNDQKKKTNAQLSGRFYRAREVWWCKLGVNIGFEQDGSGSEHARPVLILRAFSAFVCLIIPLSASTKKNKYYVRIGTTEGKEARAIISQVRLIDTRRLENKICVIDPETFDEIKKPSKTCSDGFFDFLPLTGAARKHLYSP